MIAVLIYSVIALLLLVAVVLLIRPRQAEAIHEVEICSDEAGTSWEGPDLSLAERIFNRTDYLWLREEVGLPSLAESLLRSRTQMALHWLRSVRRSFDRLVRTPGDAPAQHNPATARESWHLLRLTLRFHIILGYAILVVRLFGPYHRLIPSFGWMRPLSGRASAPDRFKSADAARFS